MACDQTAANVAISRVVPGLLCAIAIYACWTFTKPLCIDYLLVPKSPSRIPRHGMAIGLLVAFYILLISFLASYLRVLYLNTWNPDFIPQGPQYAQSQAEADREKENDRSRKRRKSDIPPDGSDEEWHGMGTMTAGHGGRSAYSLDASGLEAFYLKDVYMCQDDGKPAWCSTCLQYKSDRAHHCRDVDRCVRKMDHFCPWVGGVVSETSFKFFIQFLFYASLFTIFVLVVLIVFVVEHSKEHATPNTHWIVVLCLSGVFGLFALAMLGSSIRFACMNSTTIQDLDRRTKVWTLAVLIPPSTCAAIINPDSQWATTLRIISFGGSSNEPPSSHIDTSRQRRDFAILHTKPGENPWDLGSSLENFKQVMGHSFLDWFSPLKLSPCTDHSSQESAYLLGPVVQRLKREAGLESATNGHGTPRRDKSRKRQDQRASDAPFKPPTTPSSKKARDDGQPLRGANSPKNSRPSARRHHKHHREGSVGDTRTPDALSGRRSSSHHESHVS
ncbi:palmitoyltransferase pfa5 [Emmonsiellopsis sp. PD_33]|nr:palmitoyltransferase pfa5 [Emmonsiellopsis sp. PD_33]